MSVGGRDREQPIRSVEELLREARDYVMEAVARREEMGLETSAAHDLLAHIDAQGRS